MDIFAHGLWAGAAFKAANNKLQKSGNLKKLSIKWGIFWGTFPDLFAFIIPLIMVAWGIFFGGIKIQDLPRPSAIEPAAHDTFPAFRLANLLYNIGHSLIVFFLVFAVVWLIRKRPAWELGGWIFHVLIDIPTHSYKFYPTPLLWPVSQWKFLYGFSWAEPWFIIVNYSAIVAVYLYLWRLRKKTIKKLISNN